MPPRNDVDESPFQQERPDFGIDVPMALRKKAFCAHNAASSSLLVLPLEVRLMIWMLVFGDKTIHIGRQSGPDSAIRHNLCRSTMTESEACQLSKSQEHEIKIHTEDMKTSIDRHRNCGPGQLSSKMDIRLLTLCHTTYTEINETIWRTTTWSFNSLRLFGMWLQMRNATQLMYLSHILFDSFIPSPCVLSLPKCKMITLETLHINAYSGNMKEDLRGISEFIPSKAVSVIHYRSNYDFLTWEDSLAIAENIRQQLMAKMEDS